MTRWIRDRCSSCGGHGVVSSYVGGDFDGAKECAECGGSGFVSISEKDRVALYPGGPFRGTDPGRFAKLAAR